MPGLPTGRPPAARGAAARARAPSGISRSKAKARIARHSTVSAAPGPGSDDTDYVSEGVSSSLSPRPSPLVTRSRTCPQPFTSVQLPFCPSLYPTSTDLCSSPFIPCEQRACSLQDVQFSTPERAAEYRQRNRTVSDQAGMLWSFDLPPSQDALMAQKPFDSYPCPPHLYVSDPAINGKRPAASPAGRRLHMPPECSSHGGLHSVIGDCAEASIAWPQAGMAS